MKIEYLEFGSVGPYPGVHKIDFLGLGDSALFLIDGPTGAGKTTVIDAIVFALFGSPVGADSDKFKLRSSHAKADTETYVLLRFTVSAGTFEVRRTPQYEKVRSDGSTTTHNATCTLDRINPDGSRDNLANQVKAAGTELQKLVGLEREQFRQTVVLPQGEFAKFLMADSKERKPILQRIFATERYEKIENLLKDLSKSAREEVESLKTKVHTSIDTFKGRMDLSDERADQLKTIADSAENSNSLATELASITETLQGNLASAKAKTDELNVKHSLATAELELRKKELLSQQALVDAELELTNANSALDIAAKEIVKSNEMALRDVLIKPEQLADVSQFGKSLETVVTELADLQPALVSEATLGESEKKAGDLKDLISSQEGQLEKLNSDINTSLPATITELEKLVKNYRPVVEGKEGLVKQIDSVREVTELHQTVASISVAIQSQQDVVNEAKLRKIDADDSYEQLLKLRFANFASELATELVPGQPCSVCGSTEHPDPSAQTGELVSAETLDGEKQKVARAENAVTKAESDLATLQSELDIAQGKIKGKDLPADLDLADLEAQLENADATAKSLAETETKLEQTRAELNSANELRTSLTAELAGNKTILVNVELSIVDTKKQIAGLKHEFASIAERAAALNDLKSAIQNLEVLRSAIEQKQGVLDSAKAARNLLKDHESFGITEAAQSYLDAIATELGAAQGELAEATSKVQAAEQDIRAILGSLQTQINKSESSRALIKLSLLVTGYNSFRMPLSMYVLTTLFEEVVDAANVRLAGMLEGRYQLRTSETAAAGNRRTGLDLLIYDNRLGVDRPATALAGGEKFCVSLALALGLAEIVQSNQGGISIDTLFIDEGFGTLDSSRLSDVMNVLSGLSKQGRTVGLISHVDSMKQLITEKITAIPDLATGQSTLAVSWMD